MVKEVINYISALLQRIGEKYSKLERRREEIIRLNREILNHSVNANYYLLRGNYSDGLKEVQLANDAMEIAKNLIESSHEDRMYLQKILHEGIREYVENMLLYLYLVPNSKISVESLDSLISFGTPSIIEGIFDFIGELRRVYVELLIRGELAKAREVLNDMRFIYEGLMRLQVKNFYVPSFKRRLDILKSQIDKSLEDYLLTLVKRGE